MRIPKKIYRELGIMALAAALIFMSAFYVLRINSLTAERAKVQMLESAGVSASVLSKIDMPSLPADYGFSFYGGMGYSLVLDGDGRVLASSKSALVGGDAASLLGDEPRAKVPSASLIVSGEVGVVRCVLDGASVYVAYVPVPERPELIAATILPVEAARAQAMGIVRISLFTFAILFVLAGGITLTAYSKRERRHRLIMRQALGEPFLKRAAVPEPALNEADKDGVADNEPLEHHPPAKSAAHREMAATEERHMSVNWRAGDAKEAK